jgi:hypothetical protein
MEWIEDQMGYFKSGEEPFVRDGGSADKRMHFYLLSNPAIQLLTFRTPTHSTPWSLIYLLPGIEWTALLKALVAKACV